MPFLCCRSSSPVLSARLISHIRAGILVGASACVPAADDAVLARSSSVLRCDRLYKSEFMSEALK